MNAEQFRYRLEANALAVCLAIVGLSVAARIALEVGFRAIDRATVLGGAQ